MRIVSYTTNIDVYITNIVLYVVSNLHSLVHLGLFLISTKIEVQSVISVLEPAVSHTHNLAFFIVILLCVKACAVVLSIFTGVGG